MASVFKREKNKRSSKWYIEWFDHNGKRRRKCSNTTDKATADRIAAKLEAEAALRRERVIDPTLEAIGEQSRRSIASHLNDFTAKMKAAGRTEKHIDSTVGFVRKIADFAGYSIAADICSPDRKPMPWTNWGTSSHQNRTCSQQLEQTI